MFASILISFVIIQGVTAQLPLPLPDISEECVPSMGMIDASAKIPSGLGGGNLVDMGSFDYCLKQRVNISDETFRGKYCLMKVSETNNQNKTIFGIRANELTNLEEVHPEPRMLLQQEGGNGIILGWCLPEICDPIELAKNLSESTMLKLLKMKIGTVFNGMCQTEDDLKVELTDSDWGVISFLIVFGVIIFLSTAYDTYLGYSDKKPAYLILIAFSLKTNGSKLLAVSHNPDQLGCLHGIRFISMMWVVLGHKYMVAIFMPITNMMDVLKWGTDGKNFWISNAFISVDTFFVLSGILISYSFCLAKDKGTRFNIILFYIHRYLRLTPALAVTILVQATIFKYFGNGPFWQISVEGLEKPCETNWWTPLVYIQNYYEPEIQCLGQTWYLAVDFQLYILSPIILLPLWKWPKQTLIACCILLGISVIIPIVLTYELKLSQRALDPQKSLDYQKYIYFPTHSRFGPWLIGLMFGYYLFILKKDKQKNPQKISKLDAFGISFGWLTSLTIMLAVVFAPEKLIFSEDYLSLGFYNGFHRHGWSLALCWIIYACLQGYGGVINSFLSWSTFQILGRLTYSIYLVHLSTQYAIASMTRTSVQFDSANTLISFWGDFMLSLGIALCLTLAFESPMIIVEKALFGLCGAGGRPPRKQNTEEVLPTHQPANIVPVASTSDDKLNEIEIVQLPKND